MAGPVTEISLINQKLGHYRILEKVGSGGMGVVYRATDEHLNRDVAIKVLPPGTLTDDAARKRFRNEALMLSRLNHPNVATVHDFDTQGGIDYLVTEFIPGEALSDRLEKAPLSETRILELAIQMTEGMSAAHGKGLIHRDLKPSNLRLTQEGALKILDFGLAKTLNPVDVSETIESLTNSMSISGTLHYMSPEQLRGDAGDFRTDIYGAGAVLYEMATGRPPFHDRIAIALIDAILHSQPTPPTRWNPNLSQRFEEIVLRCLEKNPEHRHQSADDLRADLRRCMVSVAKPERSVAVLYFDNLSGNSEHDYFRDGVTEDITLELSKFRELRVFSRSAVLPYRDKPVTPAHVGQQLNAAYVVEGSIRREGERLRLTANLVEAKTGHTLWGERFDRTLKDVFAIQDEIAHCIANSLHVVLTENDEKGSRKAPTADVKAYDCYLKGRQFFHQFRRKGYDLAREMFAKAIEIDPQYAKAYAGMANCSAFVYMYWDSSETYLKQADEASRKALEIDPQLAEAHAAAGMTSSLRKQYEGAQREFEIAIDLNPKLFEPYYFYGRSCYAQGKLDEAVNWFEKASRVLPEDYQAPMLMASALHGMGKTAAAEVAYRRGLAAAEKHLELYPGDTRALYFGANALSQIDERDRAVKWAERAVLLAPEEPQVLYNVACVYALMNEVERSIDCLELSMTRGWGQREWMEHDPDLASVREHPRFKKLMEMKREQEAGANPSASEEEEL